MLRRLPILVAVASLTAVSCADATSTPRVVTLRDSGKTLTVRKGAQLQLHLTERIRWLPPRIRGSSVRLTRIEFIRDPGYRAWSIAARARGTAVVTAVGYGESMQKSCDPGPCAPHLFRVTFVVR
jgi:hypothetical protein